tara:strand:- start:3802 stop:4491 length:690 start_codon:yes stop_codon:yes gene_type:complete
MIFKPDDIYNIIDTNNFKSVRIYEGFIEDYKNKLPIEHNVFTSSQQLKDRLKSYENLYDGKFTFLLGQGLKNEQLRHLKKFKVEYYRNYIQQPNEMQGTLEYVRADEIDKKVNLLLKDKLAEMEKQKEIAEMKEKLQELDTMSGKLNYFLTKFVDGYIQKLTMNGSQMNGFTQYNQSEVETTKNINQLENALATLVDYIGEENVIKFSSKIKNGQAEHVKPIIINFINS